MVDSVIGLQMTVSIDNIITNAAARLATVSDSPRLDAEILLGQVSGWSRATLTAHPERDLDDARKDCLEALLQRRLNGEPIAYITGRREFWSLALGVSPATLIPRPETELLVERALARIPLDANWSIADLGTGNGAVALALAKERPHCRVIATDISTDALVIAERNAGGHQLHNVEFRHGDWFTPLRGEQFQIIVSNPPYVRDNDPHLSRGDVRFEPAPALKGGLDGLNGIRSILKRAKDHLTPGGWLLIEHGYDQASQVKELMLLNGYEEISRYRDYTGNDRSSECCYR